jgi:hypothetical protein
VGEDLTPQPPLLKSTSRFQEKGSATISPRRTTFQVKPVPEKEKSSGEGPGVRCLSPLTAQLAQQAAEVIANWVLDTDNTDPFSVEM